MRHCFSASVFLVLAMVSLPAHADHEIGHGGSDIGLDFSQSFYHALANIRGHLPAIARSMPSDLDTILTRAKIIPTHKTLRVQINGVWQDCVAENFRDLTIQVNEDRWTRIQNTHVKEAIALHEILSLRALENTGLYPYSAKYLAEYGLSASSIEDGFPRSLPYLSAEFSSNTGKVFFGNGYLPSGYDSQAHEDCEGENESRFGMADCSSFATAVQGCVTAIVGLEPGNSNFTLYYGQGESEEQSKNNAFSRVLKPLSAIRTYSECASAPPKDFF